MTKPDVLEREMDELELEITEDFVNTMEDAAMAHGLTMDYVRTVAVRCFTREELQYALGMLT